jgi:hypothetical protein
MLADPARRHGGSTRGDPMGAPGVLLAGAGSGDPSAMLSVAVAVWA